MIITSSAMELTRLCVHSDKQVPDTWRVSNENDIVTRIPSLLGYRHVGVEVRLAPDGSISVNRVSNDQVREGAVLTDIIPRIKGDQL